MLHPRRERLRIESPKRLWRHSQAAPLLRDALAIREKTFGPEPSDLMRCGVLSVNIVLWGASERGGP
jgi:hypothetical protein